MERSKTSACRVAQFLLLSAFVRCTSGYEGGSESTARQLHVIAVPLKNTNGGDASGFPNESDLMVEVLRNAMWATPPLSQTMYVFGISPEGVRKAIEVLRPGSNIVVSEGSEDMCLEEPYDSFDLSPSKNSSSSTNEYVDIVQYSRDIGYSRIHSTGRYDGSRWAVSMEFFDSTQVGVPDEDGELDLHIGWPDDTSTLGSERK